MSLWVESVVALKVMIGEEVAFKVLGNRESGEVPLLSLQVQNESGVLSSDGD